MLSLGLVLGLGAAALVGLTLGMLGGGGSVLAVPTLHYALGMETHAAITGSLLIVGITSLVALVPQWRRVRGWIGIVFGAASMVGAYAGGRVAHHVPPQVLLIAFAALMVVAALAMLRPRPIPRTRETSLAPLVLYGLGVGAVTGLVGAGGGFVIVPAMILIVGLSMEEAAATSLLVIAMNSFVAFGATVHSVSLDGRVLGAVLVVAILGGLAGTQLGRRIPSAVLRRGFGGLVLLVAVVILGTELVRTFTAST